MKIWICFILKCHSETGDNYGHKNSNIKDGNNNTGTQC